MIAWGDDFARPDRIAFWGALLLAIAMIALAAHDAIATERTLDAGTLSPIRVERPSALYYGEPRDTSAVARVCCRVAER